jgi:L-alanine-DL-glutamate epimerase-like enolase superfamily enzyme
VTAGLLVGSTTRRLEQIRAEDSTETTVSNEPFATLKSIERITYRYPWRGGQMREHTVLKVTTSDGLIGGAQCHGKGDLDQLRHILQGVNLCDHQRVWQAVESAEVGDGWFRAGFDVACWDVHARMRKQPLHALLGTRRQKYRPYGDERWNVRLSPDEYAKRVAANFERRGMLCTKLHVPGTYALEGRTGDHGVDGLPLETVLTILRKVREAVGDDKALAYDPHPQKAAALKLNDARVVARALDELNYEWVECLLPPEPDRIQDWLTLRREARFRFQREESPSQTADEEIRWLEAGAANQVTWDCRFGGITKLLDIIAWIRRHPEHGVVLNLHYSQPAHQQIAAALTDREQPWVESVFAEDRYQDGWTAIPQWIGAEDLDWAFIEKHRV